MTSKQKGDDQWEKMMKGLDWLEVRLQVMESGQYRLQEQADRAAATTRKAEEECKQEEEDRAVMAALDGLIGKLEARQGTKQSSRPCNLGRSDMVAIVSRRCTNLVGEVDTTCKPAIVEAQAWSQSDAQEVF